MQKGSDLLVKALENEGVDRIFGVPGEENLDFLESLRGSRIELVLTRHEQAAAFMAATHGRLTGRPGVCLATLGPGALNFSTGAAYAHLGAWPMILITGQKAVMSAKQARFQIVDIVASMKPLTKMTRQIVSPASIPATVRDAFRVAMEDRPGPVHLELPEDIAGEEVEDVAVIPVHPLERPIAPPAALDRAEAAILAARRPLVMIGAACSRPWLAEALSAFVARTRLPFFNTQMGKGAVTGGSNLYVGTAALSEGDYVHEAIARADLIIAIGHDTVEKPPFLMKSSGGPKVIHISFQSATVEQVYHPDIEVLGDIGASVDALAGRVREATARSARREALVLALQAARRRHDAARDLPGAEALVPRLADAHRDPRDRLLTARVQRRQRVAQAAQAEVIADDAEAGDNAVADRCGLRYRTAAHRVRHVQFDSRELHLADCRDECRIASREAGRIEDRCVKALVVGGIQAVDDFAFDIRVEDFDVHAELFRETSDPFVIFRQGHRPEDLDLRLAAHVHAGAVDYEDFHGLSL